MNTRVGSGGDAAFANPRSPCSWVPAFAGMTRTWYDGLPPFETGDAGAEAVGTDPQRVAGIIDEEGCAVLHAGRERGIVAFDPEAGRAVLDVLGADHDEAAVIFLVPSLDEDVAGDDTGGSGGKVDHVVGGVAGGVVEARIADFDARRAALDVMAAAAALEAGAADDQRAIVADVDAVGAGEAAVAAAEAGEGRLLDEDGRAGVGGGEDAALR